VEIATRSGPALAELDRPGPARAERDDADPGQGERAGAGGAAFLLVLTHGAGGGIGSPDLLAARDAGLRLGGTVARVLQPYRVRKARAPGSAPGQDEAWLEIISVLRGAVPGVPLVQGGRSNGARVACRTAAAAGARAVVALAFPLHPPGHPERSRAAELRAAGTDVLVVNGDRDPFGVPEAADAARVVVLPGETHALSRRPQAIEDAVGLWLGEVLQRAPG
jgi:predicted alpha/beta-hydrolase family hydrolase